MAQEGWRATTVWGIFIRSQHENEIKDAQGKYGELSKTLMTSQAQQEQIQIAMAENEARMKGSKQDFTNFQQFRESLKV